VSDSRKRDHQKGHFYIENGIEKIGPRIPIGAGRRPQKSALNFEASEAPQAGDMWAPERAQPDAECCIRLSPRTTTALATLRSGRSRSPSSANPPRTQRTFWGAAAPRGNAFDGLSARTGQTTDREFGIKQAGSLPTPALVPDT